MTFKDLKKRISLETFGRHILFERVQDKPFWFWNLEQHKAVTTVVDDGNRFVNDNRASSNLRHRAPIIWKCENENHVDEKRTNHIF